MFVYDSTQKDQTANATPNTETAILLAVAGATVGLSIIRMILAPKNFATAGAITVRVVTGPSLTTSGGGAFTPNKRNPNNPNPASTWTTAPTISGTPVYRESISAAQGGPGVEKNMLLPDEAVGILATAKCDLRSLATTASATYDFAPLFSEAGV